MKQKFILFSPWLLKSPVEGSWDLVTKVIARVAILITTYNPN